MRKLFMTFFLVIGGIFTVVGQSPTYYIKYDYDAAGNRTSRKCLEIILPQLRSTTAPIDTTGTEAELNDLKVKIYPNPTKGSIVADLSTFNPSSSVSFILYTADGRKLQQLNAESDQTSIDLSNYSPGVYLLKVLAKEKKLEFKIIKQ